MIVAAKYGMVAAVSLGLLASVLIFVIDYGQHSGVLQTASVELERSRVTRTLHEQHQLDASGAAVLIIHLRGVLFFGSAAQVDQAVRNHMRRLASLSAVQQLQLQFVVLDCERCEAVDSSAASVLTLCQQQSRGAHFVFAAANEAIIEQLERRKLNFVAFETLDLALEHTENGLLGKLGTAPTSPRSMHAVISVPADVTAALEQGEACPPDHSTRIGVGGAAAGRAVEPRRVLGPSWSQMTRAGTLERMQRRFECHIDSHVAGLAPRLLPLMEMVIVPPGTRIFDYSAVSSPGTEELDGKLYFVDSGFVTVNLHLPKPGGGTLTYRMSKVSTGAILGASALLQQSRSPGAATRCGASVGDSGDGTTATDVGHRQPSLPISAVADTYCQLLCLPSGTLERLEANDPPLACQLLRLLCLVGQASERKQALGAAASRAFGVAVQPSESLESLLLGGLPAESSASAPRPKHPASSSSDSLPIGSPLGTSARSHQNDAAGQASARVNRCGRMRRVGSTGLLTDTTHTVTETPRMHNTKSHRAPGTTPLRKVPAALSLDAFEGALRRPKPRAETEPRAALPRNTSTDSLRSKSTDNVSLPPQAAAAMEVVQPPQEEVNKSMRPHTRLTPKVLTGGKGLRLLGDVSSSDNEDDD